MNRVISLRAAWAACSRAYAKWAHTAGLGKVAPVVRAEVSIILGSNGNIAVYMSKMPDEEDVSEACGQMTNALLRYFADLGATITVKVGDHVIPLARPQLVRLREPAAEGQEARH